MHLYNLHFLKKFILLLTLITISNTKAQYRGVVGYSMYYGDKNFKSNGVFNELELGIDRAEFVFIKPQVSLSYFSASINDNKENNDDKKNLVESLNKKVHAFTLNLGIRFSNDYNYYILPQLNIARIEAVSNYQSIDYLNAFNSFSYKESSKSWQVFFGLKVGKEFELSRSSYNSINVDLIYNRLNLGKALNKFEDDNVKYNHNNFGLGVSYRFGFEKFKPIPERYIKKHKKVS